MYLLSAVWLFVVLLSSCQAQERTIVWSCDDFTDGAPFEQCDMDLDVYHGTETVDVVTDPLGIHEDVVRVMYPEGSESNGGMNGKAELLNCDGGDCFWEHAILSYDIYIEDGFDWVLGGKLPGLYGGTGQCSGGVTEDCFSVRYMWREGGDLELYAYIPRETGDWYCDDPDNFCDPYYADSFGRGVGRLETGRWIKLAMEIRLNDPDDESNDSVMAYYIDDEYNAVYSIQGLNFRDPGDQMVIDTLYLNSFFGGTGEEWQTPYDQYIHFRNFTISVEN